MPKRHDSSALVCFTGPPGAGSRCRRQPCRNGFRSHGSTATTSKTSSSTRSAGPISIGRERLGGRAGHYSMRWPPPWSLRESLSSSTVTSSRATRSPITSWPCPSTLVLAAWKFTFVLTLTFFTIATVHDSLPAIVILATSRSKHGKSSVMRSTTQSSGRSVLAPSCNSIQHGLGRRWEPS